MTDNASARAMWAEYVASQPEAADARMLVDHFCDNQHDADALAALVLAGTKRATACSLAELKAAGELPPQPGDHLVVTNWAGEAQCIVRTTQVDVVPLGQVSTEFAAIEGEGDGSLAYWQRSHRAYFQRVLASTSVAVDDALLIACERFERVYPPAEAMNSA